MKILIMILAILTLAGSALGQSHIFFSEYIEGSSNNKAVEIYNNTNAAIDLSRVKVERYNNGSLTVGFEAYLEGNLAPGDVWVIANADADPAILAVADDTINTSFTWYNGDDVLILYLDDIVEDSIGRLGEDPGSAWGTDPVTTGEHTLVRKLDSCTGDTIVDDAYDPADYFDSFPQDTFTELGIHLNNCAPVADKATSWGAVKSLFR